MSWVPGAGLGCVRECGVGVGGTLVISCLPRQPRKGLPTWQ